MGLITTIFGRSNKENDKKIKQDIQDIEMGKGYNIYPVLKPGDWIGINNGFLKQTIYGTKEDPKLVVAFAYNTPNNFIFLSPKDFEGKSKEEVTATLKKAYENLETIVSNFKFIDSLKSKVITSSGNDFSCEKVLSKNHMMQAHKLLNSNELFVSIARRRCMFITSKNVEPEIRTAFIKLHENTWSEENTNNAPVFNGIIVVVNGEIVDFIA